MVDSTPTSQAPPSRMASIRPERPAYTCAASVGLIRPDGLAEGAATGPPNVLNSCLATGCAGTRMARVGKSAVTSGDRPEFDFKGKTSVKGPGQKALARRSAESDHST